MNLEIKKNHITSFLYDELDIQGFLNLFSSEFPILPRKILSPLTPQQAKDHFEKIEKLEKEIATNKKTIDQLISCSQLIPNPEEVINALNSGSLQQFHLHILGRFLNGHLKACQLEKKSNISALVKIEKALNQYCGENFGSIKANSVIEQKNTELKQIKDNFHSKIIQIEKEILNVTGIKMIYPYPHEIGLDQKIPTCSYLKRDKQNHSILLNYNLPRELIELNNKKKAIESEIQSFFQDILKEIYLAIKPLQHDLEEHVLYRKERCYYYTIIKTRQENNLCFPKENGSLRLRNAELPSLKNITPKRYRPLNLQLEKGVTVLFGANMTGKTSVIKTLYFHLVLIQLGLPTPAKSIGLNFPKNIHLLLRSSGNTLEKLSSFGQELNFFCNNFGEDDYVLVDELFQSTNPQSGIELSKLFISSFSKKDFYFFCNTHYHEVLQQKEISLLRMKDSSLPQKSTNILDDLINSIPFEVEEVKRDDIEAISLRPLEIALHFPLNDDLKKKIEKRIENGKN